MTPKELGTEISELMSAYDQYEGFTWKDLESALEYARLKIFLGKYKFESFSMN